MRQNVIKLCAGIALLCVLFSAILAVPASAATTPAISASTVKAERGSTVSVVISLNSNPGIWSMGLRVGYDHSVLTLKGYTAGSIFTFGEITPPPSLNKETYFFLASKADPKNDTKATGKLVTLSFSVAAKATYKDYPIILSLDSGNTINSKGEGEKVAFTTSNGKVTVVNCVHKSTAWTTVTAATCLKSGSEKLVCNKCKEVLNTKTVAALGHSYTKKVISDKTKRSEATADKKATYFYTCTRCGDISDTLYFSYVPVYKVIKGANGEWKIGEATDLTFTSDGSFEKFTGIMIDGKLVDKGNYDAKSGSTIVTLKADYLKTLEVGDRTITFVYTDGKISADFKIVDTAVSVTETTTNVTGSTQNTTEAVNNGSVDKTTQNGGIAIYIIIVIIAVIILGGGAAFMYLKKGRR
jgi:hypothetical protein